MNQTNQTAKTVYLTTYWIWIALFVVAPLFLVVYYSFFDIDGNLSLENYQTFFTSTYLSMTLSSFWYAFLITFFSLLVGYPTAYLLTKTKHKPFVKSVRIPRYFWNVRHHESVLRSHRDWNETDSLYRLQFRLRLRIHFHPVHDFANLQRD